MKPTPGHWTVNVQDGDTTIEAPSQTICTNVSNCDADLLAAAKDLLTELEHTRAWVAQYLELLGSAPAAKYKLAAIDKVIARAKGADGTCVGNSDPEPIGAERMDLDCYYAKLCGTISDACPGRVCSDRRQVPAPGIYYNSRTGES